MKLAIVSDNLLAKALIERCNFIAENVIVYGNVNPNQRIKNVQYCNACDYRHYLKCIVMRRPNIIVLTYFSSSNEVDIEFPIFYPKTKAVIISNVFDLPYIGYLNTIERQNLSSFRCDGLCLTIKERDLKHIIECPCLFEQVVDKYPSLKLVNWIRSLNIYDKIDMEVSVNWRSFT